MIQRPAFNVAYVGFNQKKKPLDNPKIRQAVAYALNREALIKAKYPRARWWPRSSCRPRCRATTTSVTTYSYDPDKAKQLIAESGVKNPTIEFWYPTSVSRPYMPDPAANFQAFKSDLEKVGFKIVPKSAPWRPDYNNATQSGQAAMFLLGWTGDFSDADNFIGVFFQKSRRSSASSNKEIFSLLDNAETGDRPGQARRDVQAGQRAIMEFLPGVPYAHTAGRSWSFTKNVKGYIPSPVTTELFATVSLQR